MLWFFGSVERKDREQTQFSIHHPSQEGLGQQQSLRTPPASQLPACCFKEKQPPWFGALLHRPASALRKYPLHNCTHLSKCLICFWYQTHFLSPFAFVLFTNPVFIGNWYLEQLVNGSYSKVTKRALPIALLPSFRPIQCFHCFFSFSCYLV